MVDFVSVHVSGPDVNHLATYNHGWVGGDGVGDKVDQRNQGQQDAADGDTLYIQDRKAGHRTPTHRLYLEGLPWSTGPGCSLSPGVLSWLKGMVSALAKILLFFSQYSISHPELPPCACDDTGSDAKLKQQGVRQREKD